MSLLDTPLTATLTRAIDLTARRQTVVSQNIANIDTPGYHTQDLDFRQELLRAGDSDQPATATAFTREVQGLIERPDGNNVSIDEEASNLLLYQRAYQAAAQAITAVDQMLQTVINMGVHS